MWFKRFGPALLVLAPMVFSAVELRAELGYVPHLNDSAVHAELVRYAVAQFRAGHFPLDGWFSYLGLGSPDLLHYQSLGVMLTGLLGLGIGANQAFGLTLYLLLVTWPISVYGAGRLFGWSRWESAFAAFAAPFVVSATGVGYEQGAYLWTGFGVWTQEWGMWTLPLAWGFSWQAVNEGRRYLPAALFIALTAVFHFETGYLAFIPLVLWLVVRPAHLLERARRALIVGVGGFLLAAWAVVPLVLYRGWASIDEFLQHGPDVRSYGAGRALSWLVTGRILDNGRIPVITILAGVGLVACAMRWHRDPKSRALVAVFATSLVLFFGRASLEFLVDLLPGSRDIFFRRFIIGVQLSGVLLAGIGVVAVARLAAAAARRLSRKELGISLGRGWRLAATRVVVAGLVVGAAAPMWTEIASHDSLDASLIATQRSKSAGSRSSKYPSGSLMSEAVRFVKPMASTSSFDRYSATGT